LEYSIPYTIDEHALGALKILGEEPLSGTLMGLRIQKARFEFEVMLDLPPVPPVSRVMDHSTGGTGVKRVTNSPLPGGVFDSGNALNTYPK
jgi:hypothetical protein